MFAHRSRCVSCALSASSAYPKHWSSAQPSSMKILIDFEGPFYVSIFGGDEHLRADKGTRLRLSGVVSAGQNVILGVGSMLAACWWRRKFTHAREHSQSYPSRERLRRYR